MMNCTYENLRTKEVVDIDDGRKLGYICDLDISLSCGKIENIILPPAGKWYNPFNTKNRICIPWENIRKIGDDIILVRCCCVKPKENTDKQKY